MFLSLPHFLIFAIVLVSATATQDDAATTTSTAPKTRYMFDRDAAGNHCKNAMNDHSAEDFRLYCINQGQSFLNCALLCSEVLHFDESTGVCKSPRCNFHDLTLQTTTPDLQSSLVKMQDISPPGMVTLFAFVPLWEGHAQYIYELLELVRSQYQETTQALFLPIDVHDYELEHPRYELHPYSSTNVGNSQRVIILPEIMPNEIVKHPFLDFVRSLLWREGAQNFDVYTDRPVIFVISQDGFLVKRMVVPTWEELQTTIVGYGGGVSTKVM